MLMSSGAQNGQFGKRDQGLGTASISVIYAALILSSFILPSLMIKRLGCKWTIVACIPMYTLYILSNFYATWYTLMPTSILVGLAAAPLWASKCTYLTTLSHHYAKITGERPEAINARFFGFFFMVFHFDQVIGNLISSLTLNPGIPELPSNAPSTDLTISDDYSVCGVNYCNQNLDNVTYIYRCNNITNATCLFVVPQGHNPPLSQVYTMCGIYMGLSALGAVLIALFVTPLKQFQTTTLDLHGFKMLKVSLKQAVNPMQLLMIPLTVFSGLAQSYITSDFTKAFVTCTLGIHYIGYVMICAGLTDAAFSWVFGQAMKYAHRSIIYTIGTVICIGLYVAMLSWHHLTNNLWPYFTISAFWGVADSVWQTHFNAFYGILFKDNLEVAFASYRLWESVGYMVGFAWSDHVCVKIKLLILLPLVIFGMITYGVVEIILKRQRKLQKES
ncbi:Protein unc-93 A, variant 3 [Chamberlinius hualienensis]